MAVLPAVLRGLQGLDRRGRIFIPGNLSRRCCGHEVADPRPPRTYVDICIDKCLFAVIGVKADGFDWDAGNRLRCQKHDLSIAPIEHVVSHAETLIVPDGKNSALESRLIAIGRTPEGRFASVAFTPRVREGLLLVRPISARYMHEKEVARYEKESSALQNR
jgi:uncharacterized DUF497 family protein